MSQTKEQQISSAATIAIHFIVFSKQYDLELMITHKRTKQKGLAIFSIEARKSHRFNKVFQKEKENQFENTLAIMCNI